MLIELTQIYFEQQGNEWKTDKISIDADYVVGFYPYPEAPEFTSIMLTNQKTILVQEDYAKVFEQVDAVTYQAPAEEPAVPQVGVWISCADHLPDRNGDYLVTTNNISYSVDFGTFRDGKWKVKGAKVIAWMDIPKPSWMKSNN